MVTETTRYPLQRANQALADLRAGRFRGRGRASVLTAIASDCACRFLPIVRHADALESRASVATARLGDMRDVATGNPIAPDARSRFAAARLDSRVATRHSRSREVRRSPRHTRR